MKGIVGVSQTRSIQTNTTSLKIMVREEKTFNDILAKLEKQNLKILSVNKAEPTLEDVYISLVGRGFEEENPG
jgi:ABC-type multidrug transport system ATPase subunit